jgi:hypothetical protein
MIKNFLQTNVSKCNSFFKLSVKKNFIVFKIIPKTVFMIHTTEFAAPWLEKPQKKERKRVSKCNINSTNTQM